MVDLWGRDIHQASYAIGPADLTAIDKAQAALIVGELNAIDWIKAMAITHTKPRTIRTNAMTSGMIEKRISAGRILGTFNATFFVQTAILAYMVMGACTTTGVGDPYTHTISKATTTAPPWIAWHIEKEGTNAQRRKDLLGFVPVSLDIYVSEANPIAYQVLSGFFAYTGAGADLANPTQFAKATHRPYTWYDYKNSSGASAFTYNGGAINVDIIDVHMHLGWSDKHFGTYDGSGYPTDGQYVPPFVSYVELGVKLTDEANTILHSISDLDPSSYAGDLDFICDFYQDANRYYKTTWDKMFIDPDSYQEELRGEGQWHDTLKFRLDFLDENSSVSQVELNSLDDDYYENPA